MNTTMTAVGSIVSGVTTFFIAFSFAAIFFFQKEKLHCAGEKSVFSRLFQNEKQKVNS